LLNQVRDAYVALCNYKKQVFPVESTELNDIISVLDGQGLLSVIKKRDVKLIELVACADEVEGGCAGSPMLMEVLDNGLKALEKINN
jgi:hypothetical protein